MAEAWRIWVDTGGTFTDCVAVDGTGRVRRAKVLSSSALRGRIVRLHGRGQLQVHHDWWPPDASAEAGSAALPGMRFTLLGAPAETHGEVVGVDPARSRIHVDGLPPGARAGALFELRADEEAPILGARLLTGSPIGMLAEVEMRLGTTRGTNALLERRGSDVALFVTEGHGDLLEIGTQQRPELFALDIRKPAPLHVRTVEVPGRLAADGTEVRPLDLSAVKRQAKVALASGVRSAAVVLMHSWINPAHEQRLGAALREMGFEHVSLSSELAPLIKILPRAQTAVVNAYLAGVMEQYLSRVTGAMPADGRGGLHIMTSGGGLVSAGEFRPKDSLLSGPAGGVVGAAAAGRAAGFARTIAFDMGGTSTDVSRFEGDYQYVFEHTVGDASIVAPALAIETVAAGGGSVCWVEHGALRVGPHSAGASPGPACYGEGGPLTITDCNLLLGRLHPERFGIPVRIEPARERLQAAALLLDESARQEPEALAEGFLEIACERMAEAIARISVRQGYDAAQYALVAFGGAGGQHACGVALRLGMTRIVLPRDAGLLSAIGLGEAVMERFAQRQVLALFDDVDVRGLLAELEGEAESLVRQEGATEIIVRRRLLEMRLAGQESTMTIEYPQGADPAGAIRAFHERYVQVYGHAPPDRPVEVESARVVASSREAPMPAWSTPRRGVARARPSGTRQARFAGRQMTACVHERDHLSVGTTVDGPALIVEAHSTSVIEPGWRASVHASGALVVELVGSPGSTDASGAMDVASEGSAAPLPVPAGAGTVRAVRDEVIAGRLLSIADEMGEMLRRTALSTNVKERLDFSCAILDAEGRLIANAPHIPVHLGSLGVCVRSVREALDIRPGDVVVTNHPAMGGSHLPDITAVTPVHDADGRLLAFVASRAHHAEIGGISPGSMPTRARSLAEEGVVIPAMYLVRAGRARWDELERVLSSGPWPSRAVQENLADLRAQVAANHYGAEAIGAFAGTAGASELWRGMEVLSGRAAAGTGRIVKGLAETGRVFEAVEHLDDGSPLRVRIDISDSRVTIDFTGSAPVHAGNLNATPAIVRSAVIYTLRLLVAEPLPLNEGLLRNVEIIIPDGMLSPRFDADPSQCPAVAGGNVETSQRIVDTLLKALNVCACSQGTMNNVVFGTERYGYYETICGGAGAGRGFCGASAVHTHMTNTRITDPEVMEHRYPVRLERFSVRRGSGGNGRFRGGDGAVREVVFLGPCELSIISQHRSMGPYGMAGGGAGAPGGQRIVRADGSVVGVRGIDARRIEAGDRLVVETPGGGGWGA